MTLYVNSRGAHPDNIEFEGTGGRQRGFRRNVSGVIYFANTGVRSLMFSDENGSTSHTAAGRALYYNYITTILQLYYNLYYNLYYIDFPEVFVCTRENKPNLKFLYCKRRRQTLF